MTNKGWVAMVALAVSVSVVPANAASISGSVTDASGKALEGVMVTAFDSAMEMNTTVSTQADGSYAINGLRDASFDVRVRLDGQLDIMNEGVDAGTKGIDFSMNPATGEDLEAQRTADSAFGMLAWDNAADKENFKMMCTYCHQVGSAGFRAPEEPVDWETMITRMDGFGGLYKHTQETLVQRLVDTYSEDAVAKWPAYDPGPAPSGAATKAIITEWDMGELDNVMIHDLELSADGKIAYGINMSINGIVTLDTETGERADYSLPAPYRGPHSIEMGNDGNMWLTLCISGEMAKFDVTTKEWTIASSAAAPRPRGAYPHTLRINPEDPEGLVWYTDAGMNACFSMHPDTLEVTQYDLLKADQVSGSGGRGESRGVTPYGIDFSPVDGMIWYTKLNGNRIGRINPNVEGGDIKEWNPPFRGPRRLHVAQDGLVWVPGFGSGVFGSFDPKTEKWDVYDLPDALNKIPYALNVAPDGAIWITGTGSDSVTKFDPKTKEMTEFRMPTRVTYTREFEFGPDGSIWTCNSNAPVRHTERGRGSIIKIELIETD